MNETVSPAPGVGAPLTLERDDFLAMTQHATQYEGVDFQVEEYLLVMATHQEKNTREAWDTTFGNGLAR